MITRYEDNAGLYETLFTSINKLLHNLAENKDKDGELIDDDTNPFYRYNDKGVKEKVSDIQGKAKDILKILNGGKEPSDGNWSSINIRTLEEYFGVIASLSKYINSKYRILPLSEPYFDIDINTRQILPPNGNNTYAVKGDDYAETIYFKVHRYFDHIDLASKNIVIEWDNGTVNGKGMTEESIRDLVSEPEYIIFGWTLTKEATSAGNSLKFTIRFYDYDPVKGVRYSLSTMPTTIFIREGLNHDFKEYKIIKPSDRITNLLLQDNDINGIVRINAPEFFLNLSTDLVNGTDLGDIKVLAYSKDSGNLAYEWYKGNELSTGGQVLNAEQVIPAQDFTLIEVENIDKIEEQLIPYSVYCLNTDPSSILNTREEIINAFNEGKTVYCKYGVYKIDKSGYYYCVAVNSYGESSKTKTSNFVWVPYPAKPIVDTENADNIFIYILDDNTDVLTPSDIIVKYKFDTTNKLEKEKETNNVSNIIKQKSAARSGEFTEYEGNIELTENPGVPQNFAIFAQHTLNNETVISDNHADITVYNPINTPKVTVTQDNSTQKITLNIENINTSGQYIDPTVAPALLEREIQVQKYNNAQATFQDDSSFNNSLSASLTSGEYRVLVRYKIKTGIQNIETVESKTSDPVRFIINADGLLVT